VIQSGLQSRVLTEAEFHQSAATARIGGERRRCREELAHLDEPHAEIIEGRALAPTVFWPLPGSHQSR